MLTLANYFTPNVKFILHVRNNCDVVEAVISNATHRKELNQLLNATT